MAASSSAAYLAGPFPSGRALTEHDVTPTVPPTPSEEHAPPTHLYADLPPHLMQPDNTPDYLRLILNADIYDLVKQTPLQPGVNLSSKTGCNVLLKREDLQPVFSFKLRGAFNMMQQLDPEQKWKGVIACSPATMRRVWRWPVRISPSPAPSSCPRARPRSRRPT